MLKHLTLSALFYCFLFAFQLVVFPFVAFCKPKDYVSAVPWLSLVMRMRISR